MDERLRDGGRVRSVTATTVDGWVFLPDEGLRMHRTDRTGPGRTLCGRDLDPAVPVLQHPRRAFSICLACRDAGAQYPIPQPAAADGPTRKPWQRVVDGPRLGWVQLPKPALRVLHRPDPYIPDRTLCELPMPGRMPILETPPSDWAHCDTCRANIDADPDEARRQRDLHEPPSRAELSGRPRQRRPKPAQKPAQNQPEEPSRCPRGSGNASRPGP
jgi:hypothetical protein